MINSYQPKSFCILTYGQDKTCSFAQTVFDNAPDGKSEQKHTWMWVRETSSLCTKMLVHNVPEDANFNLKFYDDLKKRVNSISNKRN